MNRENEHDFVCACLLSKIEERLSDALERWANELKFKNVDQVDLMDLMVKGILAKTLADSKCLLMAAGNMKASKPLIQLQMEMVGLLKRLGLAVIEPWNDASTAAASGNSTRLLKSWGNKNPLASVQAALLRWNVKLKKCRERHAQNADHQENSKPLRGKKLTFFVASSSEAEKTARKLIKAMRLKAGSDKWKIYFWKDRGVFVKGESTLESLESIFRKCDFGIYMLTADDKLVMRKKQKLTPRGNVVFELGMGVGVHGRRRSFIVHDDVYKISDLNGISTLEYKQSKTAKTPPADAIDEIVDELVLAVNKEVARSAKH